MTTLVVRGPAAVNGSASVPGDRSICNRALMLGAVADGTTLVRNIGTGEDVVSMIRCLAAFGVRIEQRGVDATVGGRGMRSWTQPAAALDCGNSGGTMRMLAGFAAHYSFPTEFDGDASLRRRPMERIAVPLRALGASVRTADGGCPPITVSGGSLIGTRIEIGVASAQVKSCVLFAGLAADGETTLVEPRMSRDHSERLLAALGVPIERSEGTGGTHHVRLRAFAPPPFELGVPGDVSSAAFLVAAGALTGEVRIDGVGLNRTRTGFLDAVRRMGASVEWQSHTEAMGEPVGTIEVSRARELDGITISDAGPEIHDELPLLAVMATQANGDTIVRGAAELRVKESDRIAALVDVVRRLGGAIEDLADGFVVSGPTPLYGAVVDSCGDHRIAMAAAVAGLIATGETRVEGFASAGVSWPGFDGVLASLGADVEVA